MAFVLLDVLINRLPIRCFRCQNVSIASVRNMISGKEERLCETCLNE